MEFALVLSGGGARGAYEVGLLLYLAEFLKEKPFPFQILTGSSIGAIHAGYLAGISHSDWQKGVERLAGIWRDLRFRDSIRLRKGILKLLFRPPQHSLFGFLNVSAFRSLVVRNIDWRGIRRSLEEGVIRAVAISTTEIASGRSVVFYDTSDPVLTLTWQNDPRIVGVRTRIGPKHVLASSSIPLLFPPVPIGKKLYADGSLRLNIPLSPALRLGADRVFVVCMRPLPEQEGKPEPEREVVSASPLYLLARTLDVLFADPLERDLQQLRMMNALIRSAETPEGKKQLDEWAVRFRGAPFRYVEPFVICPSLDLTTLVEDALRQSQTIPFWIKKWVLRKGSYARLDLLSFLLFDGSYARSLIELGYSDLKGRQKELEAFFSDAVVDQRSRRHTG
jgi:NTE family protein